jgi:hypothetical protein
MICTPNANCVECVTSADCITATKPICDLGTGTCVACTSDDQCVAKLASADPGVCMAHVDGHCATVAETIFVKNDTATCSDTAAGDPGFGTSGKPLCSMQPVVSLLSTTRDLVVVRGAVSGGNWTFSGQGAAQMTIVGQQPAAGDSLAQVGSATTPAFAISGGTAFIRDLEMVASSSSSAISVTGGSLSLQGATVDRSKRGIDITAGSLAIKSGAVTNNSAIGINATGGTLTLNAVTIDSCAGGGIFLGGAAFDIANTSVTNNGPGPMGTNGGVVVGALPATGSAQLTLSTIKGNKQIGITCAGPIQADRVYVAANTGGDVAQSCGFDSCPSAGPSCGAQ